MIEIREDCLDHDAVQTLLSLHLSGMQDNSPPSSVYALDPSGLRQPDVTLWSIWVDESLAAIGALKALPNGDGEIKSMRTDPLHLGTGMGERVLLHIIEQARKRGYRKLCLETGSGKSFEAAIGLYRKNGFVSGPAFGAYTRSTFNQFFHLALGN